MTRLRLPTPSSRSSRSSLAAAAPLVALALASGCSMGGIGSGDLGVTPGGVQDNRLARALIEDGLIPAGDTFRVEGIFSEHDLPFTDADTCAAVLCPRAALARHEPLDGRGGQLLVQIGFATNIHSESFEREPLNLALAVDISGSMSGEKIDAVRDALHTLTDQLGADDRVALIAFDDASDLRLKSTVMDASGRASLHAQIDGLEVRGGTNIEAGLSLAFEQVAPHAGAAGVEDRVMLLTDAQPNVGATGLDSFLGMTRYYAEAEVGTSVFGVGLDLGAELAQEMSAVRGGNYFFLADAEAIATVFDDEFDYIVTPLAYDFEATVRAAEGWVFGEAYGAPLDQPSEGVQIGASTLFLSARGGGVGVALRPGASEAIPATAESVADFDLSYLPVGAEDPEVFAASVPWSGGLPYQASFVAADDLGVFKMAALVDEYLALQAGADFCASKLPQADARARVVEAAARLDEVATILGDDALADESALMHQLADNIDGGVGSCNDSPYYY
ncbi:MAG: VWA domain-containing protein [Nannocystaceae bacterium]